MLMYRHPYRRHHHRSAPPSSPEACFEVRKSRYFTTNKQKRKKNNEQKDNTHNKRVNFCSSKGRGRLIAHISSLISIRLISLYFDPDY